MGIKVEIENDCVGCPMGCINCGRKHTRYYYLFCDRCDCEAEELFDIDGELLCEDCLKEEFKKVTDDNAHEYVEE